MTTRSLNGVFSDGEPDDPSYIFGNTAPVPDDVIPTEGRTPRHRPFKRVRSNKQMRKAMRAVSKATDNPARNPLLFAQPTVSAPEPEAPVDAPPVEDWKSHTYTEIPDGDGPRRHPVFGINPDIVFDQDYSPERDAESRIPVENLVTYEQEDVERVTAKAQEATDEVQRRLLEEGAALLMSYDDASSFAEAMLRDALGITVEIDSSVSEAISHMMRLNMISAYMEKMSMPDTIKVRYMRILTEKIAEDTHTSINKALTSEKYNNVLKNLQARVKADPERATADLAGQLGVVRRRSGGGGGSSGRTATDSQHALNEQQNAGVRLEGL